MTTVSPPPSSRGPHGLAFLAGVGPELVCYLADADACTLSRALSLRLPQNIQYAWPSPSGEVVYVATSDGGSAAAGQESHLTAVKIDWDTGALKVHGPQVPLRARPIHLSLDGAGRYVLTAAKPFMTVHQLNEDGSIGKEISQTAGMDVGFYPHQIRVAPSDKTAIIVSRGYRARADPNRDAQPGGLHVLDFREGRLTSKAVVAPDGGHSFGPRHLDFHPTKPWMYVSLELQNQLQMFDFRNDTPSPRPLFAKDTLRASPLVVPHQALGPLHVHPNGPFVYTANRASGKAPFERKSCFVGGENSIAVFAINQKTGEPTLIQNADSQGIHPRTFALDPTGRMLVAGHIKGAFYRDTSSSTAYVPACLSVFRVGPDGRLTFARRYEVETDELIYWSGMVARSSVGVRPS